MANSYSISTPFLKKSRKGGGVHHLEYVGLSLLLMIICAEGQTFQYSRGWTNGKRGGGGGGGGGQYLDLENAGILPLGSSSEPLEVILPPGHLQMNLNPSNNRFRSSDTNQYIVKRMAVGNGNSRKPLWYGTILGVDGSGSGTISSSDAATSAISSNSNPSRNSRASGSSDF